MTESSRRRTSRASICLDAAARATPARAHTAASRRRFARAGLNQQFVRRLGGIGTGAVYGTCVGNALKWFPGRRGLAAGITAAGFGAGAAITIAPISKMINAQGYEHAFLFFGLLQAPSCS